MKILISAYACNPIGTEESYPGEAILGWNLIRQISNYHELIVITREYNKCFLEEKFNQGEINNVDFCYIELPLFLEKIKKNFFGFRIYYWIWQIKAFFLAGKLNKNLKFDAAHQITFNNDWMPSYIGAYLDIPFIWGPAGGGQKVPRVFVNGLNLRDRLNEIARFILQEFWRHTPTRIIGMKKAKAVLVCNEETRKKVERFNENIYHFPVNGISSENLNPYRRSRGQKDFKVLSAGRFDYWKNFPMGLKGFSEFIKKHPNSMFELVGSGEEEKKIRRIIDELGLEKFVKITPWLPRYELFRKMREADVFLYPSLREGGGAVVVEAMASGLPVICLDLAGPGFHIKDKWGIKIQAKNPGYVVEKMAKALEKLYLDNKLRIQMGINARKRAEEYYLWDHLGERLQRIYKDSLKSVK